MYEFIFICSKLHEFIHSTVQTNTASPLRVLCTTVAKPAALNILTAVWRPHMAPRPSPPTDRQAVMQCIVETAYLQAGRQAGNTYQLVLGRQADSSPELIEKLTRGSNLEPPGRQCHRFTYHISFKSLPTLSCRCELPSMSRTRKVPCGRRHFATCRRVWAGSGKSCTTSLAGVTNRAVLSQNNM